MNVGLIAARYAKALYEFSASAGEENRVYEELEMIHEQVVQVHEFGETLLSPIVSHESKIRLMQLAVGKTPSASLNRFFKLLLNHRREALLPAVCHSYKRLYDKEKGILKVRLTTAVPIGTKREKAILQQLEASTGKKIELMLAVQPDIIGGYVLMTDEKRLDASVKTKLLTIRKQLTI